MKVHRVGEANQRLDFFFEVLLMLDNDIRWLYLVCSVLVNSDTLTANYGVKQSQFIKSTSELLC